MENEVERGGIQEVEYIGVGEEGGIETFLQLMWSSEKEICGKPKETTETGTEIR